jgi:acetyl esterase/lipase
MLDDRNETPSSHEFAGRWPGWPREMNLLGWQALLGAGAGGPDTPAYAAPSRSADLRGSPATYIDCGALEVFRDEVIDYAQRLMQAGVAVEFHCWPGVFHGWELVAPDASVTGRALGVRYAALERALYPSRRADA